MIDLDKIDLNAGLPAEETARQYYYMAKCREYVKKTDEKIGHKPLCCVTTFGCQVNIVHEI